MKSSFRLKILIFLLTLTVFVLLYTTILNETIQKSHQNQTVICSQQQQPLLNSASVPAARYIDRYPFLLDCQNSYKVWSLEQKKEEEPKFNYSKEAPSELHDIRITRAVIIYFPLNKLGEFKYEFKWLYRSWLNMIGYEPTKWRTDLIVFIEKNDTIRAKKEFFFTDMNCKFENVRTSPTDMPMCTLVEYFPISKRQIDPKYKIKDRDNIDYDVFFKGIDIFSQNIDHFNSYYMLLKDSLSEYHYTDSIMMAFDGYEYFKKAGYDFLVRSDMDVFLTPLFAKWLPRYCNDFYVGRGGYSNTFNSKRFKRIASNIGLSYAGQNNLGSTWYSTPTQFRLVSYLTLLGMAYLNNEEFAQPAREKKLGTLMWPEWHYGVLLLYGQHLLLNHLIGTNQINVVKLQDQLDYPSGNDHSIYKMIHIHVFHGDNLFSKLVFRMGKYDNMTSELDKPENKARENQVNWFSFKMAMEGKYLKFEDLADLLSKAITKKT